MVENLVHILPSYFSIQIVDGLLLLYKVVHVNHIQIVYSVLFSFLLIGDNILAVLKYLATSDMLASSSEYRHGNMVFFDVFGLFVIAYPSRIGSVINYMVVVAVVLYLSKKLMQPKHKSKYFPLNIRLICSPYF
jgi:hypothetical protein